MIVNLNEQARHGVEWVRPVRRTGRRWLAGTVVLGALALSACGSDDPDAASKATTTTSEPAAAQAESVEAVAETPLLEAIEPLRREKVLGSGLEAEVTVPADAPQADLEELFITATVTRGQDIAVTRTSLHKCGRCWRHLPEVTEDGTLCDRCADVVGQMEAAQ